MIGNVHEHNFDTSEGSGMQAVTKSNYTCPLCHAGIALDDVNVATDIALCRACGKTSSFADVIGVAEISSDVLQQPPKYVQITSGPQEGTVITYKKLSAILLFLLPFTAIWSGGSMWGIYGRQISNGSFDLGQSLFGLPFLIGTLILVSLNIILLFGSWKITLLNGQGSVFFGAGSLGWNRRFIYSRDTLVGLRNTTVRVNNVPQKGILIQNGDVELTFGSLFPEPVKHYIAAAIKKEIESAPLSRVAFI